MRAVLSEQAVARMGRWGWGALCQVRELQVGVRVARGLMVPIVGDLDVAVLWLYGGRMGLLL